MNEVARGGISHLSTAIFPRCWRVSTWITWGGGKTEGEKRGKLRAAEIAGGPYVDGAVVWVDLVLHRLAQAGDVVVG